MPMAGQSGSVDVKTTANRPPKTFCNVRLTVIPAPPSSLPSQRIAATTCRSETETEPFCRPSPSYLIL